MDAGSSAPASFTLGLIDNTLAPVGIDIINKRHQMPSRAPPQVISLSEWKTFSADWNAAVATFASWSWAGQTLFQEYKRRVFWHSWKWTSLWKWCGFQSQSDHVVLSSLSLKVYSLSFNTERINRDENENDLIHVDKNQRALLSHLPLTHEIIMTKSERTKHSSR